MMTTLFRHGHDSIREQRLIGRVNGGEQPEQQPNLKRGRDLNDKEFEAARDATHLGAKAEAHAHRVEERGYQMEKALDETERATMEREVWNDVAEAIQRGVSNEDINNMVRRWNQNTLHGMRLNASLVRIGGVTRIKVSHMPPLGESAHDRSGPELELWNRLMYLREQYRTFAPGRWPAKDRLKAEIFMVNEQYKAAHFARLNGQQYESSAYVGYRSGGGAGGMVEGQHTVRGETRVDGRQAGSARQAPNGQPDLNRGARSLNGNEQNNGARFNGRADAAIDTPEQQDRILQRAAPLVEEWRRADSQAKRDMAEGKLLMAGIDTSASDIEHNDLKIVPRDQRGIMFFIGIIKLGIAFFQSKEKNQDQPSSDKKSADVPESEKNEKELTELKKKEEVQKKELEELDAQVGKEKTSPAELEKKRTEKKKSLEETREQIKKLEARQAELKKAKGEPEKKDEKKLDAKTASENFRATKGQLIKELQKSFDELLSEKNKEELKQLIVSIVKTSNPSFDTSAIESRFDTDLPRMTESMKQWIVSLVDSLDVDFNSDNKVRLTTDPTKIKDAMLDGKVIVSKATVLQDIGTKLFPGLMTKHLPDGKFATEFMTMSQFDDLMPKSHELLREMQKAQGKKLR